MEQSLTAWLLPALALVAGVAIGFLIARLLPNAAPNKVQRQMDDLQDRFDSYQREVVTHFNTTASLVKKLTQSYQDVQEHLSDGAQRLALDEQTRQRLLAALHADEAYPAERRERLTPPASGEVPKDYAPKSPDSPRHLRPERQVLTRCANLPTPMKKPRIRGAFSWLRDDQIAWRSRNRSSTCFTPSSTLSAWVSITRSASSGTS